MTSSDARALRDRLEALFAQVDLDERGYSIHGERVILAQAGQVEPASLIEHLQGTLYSRAYAAADARSATEREPAPSPDNLTSLLSEANLGCARWDQGWQIWDTLPGGAVLAVKGAWVRTLAPGAFVCPDGGPARAGAGASVHCPVQSLRLQPGYYAMFGEVITGDEDSEDLVRIYWNVAPDGAARLVAGLSRALNQLQVPFSFK